MTQWPRYEVFKQDKSNKPHEAIGTVHAPDAEMALLNARNVHVRRPACHSLWVVPESAILKVTAQQLASHPQDQADENSTDQHYEIFCKRGKRRSMIAATHVGTVEASTANMALSKMLEHDDSADVWWVVPQQAITRSDDELIESWFEPAQHKTYRHQSGYGKVQVREAN